MSDTASSSVAPKKDQDPEAIITLACPSCDFALNMRRKHVGLKGKCISCSEPIRAVEEEPGQVVVKWEKSEAKPQAETKVAHEIPAKAKSPAESEASPKPEPQAVPSSEDVAAAAEPGPATLPEPQEPAHAAAAEPAATPEPEVGPELEPNPEPPFSHGEPKSESKWGFPDRPATPGESQQPTPESEIEAPESTPPPEAKPKPSIPADGFFEEFPSGVSESSDNNYSGNGESSSANVKCELPAFSNGELDDVVSLFDSEKDEDSVNPVWGTKVPDETHASISPFSTGSAETDGGFAETLFREGAEKKIPAETSESTSAEKPKNALFSEDSSAGFGTNALFGAGAVASSPVPAPAPVKKPAEVNEDGHELRPLSTEEEEEMAKTMLGLQNDRDKRSTPGWMKLLKKLFKLFAAVVILMGIGYGAYVVMPEEKAAKYKDFVMEWLEPGMVIFDYLPGKNGEKSKGFQELDKLKGNVDDYYKEAQDQVNSTVPEDGEGYDFDEDRGGSGNDENATGLDQLDKLKGDIQGYQKRSQDELNSTYDGESGLDFDEGRPPEVMEKLKDSVTD